MEKSEWRTDLDKIYKKVKVCKLCRLEYGIDTKGRWESGICPKCSHRARLSFREGVKVKDAHRWQDD